jgi:hypothetical protein
MAARFRMRIAAILAGPALLSACAVAPPPIPADPQAASKMSLEEAKDTIQRGIRWVWSDGTGDHDFQVWEFAVDRIDSYIFARNGRTARYTSCPYEAFDPYVIADNGVFFFGVHKGQAASAAFLGGGDCGSWAGISVPTPDRANHVAAALLRWKTSTLAERQAYFAEQQQGFASIAANYRNTTPRPPVPEDLRRVQVVAEEAVREERFVEAADAYERALERAVVAGGTVQSRPDPGRALLLRRGDRAHAGFSRSRPRRAQRTALAGPSLSLAGRIAQHPRREQPPHANRRRPLSLCGRRATRAAAQPAGAA